VQLRFAISKVFTDMDIYPFEGGSCNLFVVFSSEQSHTRVYFSLWLRYDMEIKAFHLTRIYPALAGVTNGENQQSLIFRISHEPFPGLADADRRSASGFRQ
jgi:hypothetical protein